MLKIADNFTLPLDAITQTFGILAVRGAGKSHTAAVMAEEMFAAHLPFVVIDPVGAWWGLRSSGDGQSAGLPLPIFGGRHGDVPLERAAGQMIANLIVDNRLSCILDVSELSEGDKIRFLCDLSECLYRRNTEPLHLFLEEADDYIPQRPMREQARLLRAFENIVRRGRSRGLGMTMITQRSAAINKNVLTQIETLFVLRTTSPQDRKAIEAWVEYYAQDRELLESLPGLENGEAWVWSPQWLKKVERVRVRRRWTFDSGATPKQAKSSRKPATLADVDLQAIGASMTEAIERAKADDPRELRAEIAHLRQQIKALQAGAPKAEVKVERVEVPVISDAQLNSLNDCLAEFKRVSDSLGAAVGAIGKQTAEACQALASSINAYRSRLAQAARPVAIQAPSGRRSSPVSDSGGTPPFRGEISVDGKLIKAERSILSVLAQYPQGRSKTQIAILAGYSVRGGGFNNAVGSLRSRGYVANGGDMLRATEAGLAAIAALGEITPLPSGQALRDYWMRELGKAERSILSVLIAEYPGDVALDELARQAGYAANGGGFNNACSRLRTLELAAGRGRMRASDDLMTA